MTSRDELIVMGQITMENAQIQFEYSLAISMSSAAVIPELVSVCTTLLQTTLKPKILSFAAEACENAGMVRI